MRLWTLASRLPGLTHLHVTGGDSVSDDGLRAIASLTGLAHLHLRYFHRVTDEGVATAEQFDGAEIARADGVRQCITRGDYGAAAAARTGLARAVLCSK